MTATFPDHLLPDLALVAKDQAPPNPDALVAAGLAYRLKGTGTLRPTLEGRTMLETQADLDRTKPLCLEIGALQYLLRETERERDVAEAQKAYWKAVATKDAGATGEAEARLEKLGVTP